MIKSCTGVPLQDFIIVQSLIYPYVVYATLKKLE